MSTGTSRRGAFGLALLPFAGNLADDWDAGGESNAAESNAAEVAEGGATFHLEGLREDGSTVLAASPVQLDDIEAVLTGAGFRVHRHSAPRQPEAGVWSRPAAPHLPRKGKS